MEKTNSRVSTIMGAGAVLDMSFPCGIIKPTTSNITNEVRKPYKDIFNDKREITVVDDIYQRLMKTFPVDSNIWWKNNPTPNINFENLFHVMEQLIAYESAWSGNNKNQYTFPFFAPFTSQNKEFSFSKEDLRQIMWEFIMRIMDIVNDYDNYFRNDNGKENWYRDFFKSDFKWDIFNFNYDTTVEQCLGVYEDGFDKSNNRIDAVFRPQKLFNNVEGVSTVNHLHGCITYYYKDNINNDFLETNIHDLYCYPNYSEVKQRMMGRAQSNQSAQNNEEYFAGPIITGLRKTDKLSCMPYDFYHGNLYNAILRNNAMVIVGYSFGDIYVNNLINRMHAIWEGKERIVLIDKWDGTKILGSKMELEKYIMTLPKDEVCFLNLISGCTNIGELMKEFIDPDVNHPKYSKNGCLMLLTSGMKVASNIIDDIYSFLNS